MKSKQFVIDDQLFDFNWLVVLGGELQHAVNSYCKRIHSDPWKVEDKKQEGHFSAHTGYKNGVIWFKDRQPKPPIIAHECLHAVIYFAEKMELEINEKTEEVFTYYLDMLVQSICDNL